MRVLKLTHSFARQKLIGFFLLFIALLISLSTLMLGQFGDEADNLVVGKLMAQGNIIYFNLFSHHFPFPYFWSAFVIFLLGRSIFILRLSLLMYQFMAILVGMKLTKQYLILGLSAIIWSIIRTFYRGHLLIYSSFAGISVAIVLFLLLFLFYDSIIPDWRWWLSIGGFSAVAVLSDPLTIYAIAIAMIFLFLKKPMWGIKTGLALLGFLSPFFFWLILSGSYLPFWENVILFNSQIYSKYNYSNPLRLSELFKMATTMFDLSNGEWYNFDPAKQITSNYTDIDRWLYTGFLFRFVVLLCVGLIVGRRKWFAATFLYIYTAAVLVISTWDFRAQGFILIAVLMIPTLILKFWLGSSHNLKENLIHLSASAIVVLLTLVLVIRLSGELIKNDVKPWAQFFEFQEEAERLAQLSCYQKGVKLAHYPSGSYYYWFSNMEPVSEFVYMWPWVAEIGQDKVVAELSDKDELAIVVLRHTTIWNVYDTRVYLGDLETFLQQNYHKVSEDTYLSPELYNLCKK